MFSSLTRDITKGDVLRYLFMPQILPRLNAFYKQGFSRLALLIAQVYRAVKILPENHQIFLRENRHSLSLLAVLRAAAGEIQFTRNNIDKIIIYFAILLGLVLLAVQFFMTLCILMMNPAFAMANPPKNYGDFFQAPDYDRDIAYNLLYRVFGVPELFHPGGGQTAFHTGLQALFQMYSVGILVIAVIITCYYIFAIVVETAQTGVPFGKRYNHVWTPIRLVFALGLLIPVGYGLNSAQWITLYAAKFGSDFATKGWVLFNDSMNQAYLKNAEERVGVPQTPDFMYLAAYMMTVDACKYAYEQYYTNPAITINAYLVRGSATSAAATLMTSKDFLGALEYFNDGDIIIRFGQYSTDTGGKELGNVIPWCGELIIRSSDSTEIGAQFIQEAYYNLVADMYSPDDPYKLTLYGTNFIKKYMPKTVTGTNSPVIDATAAEPPTDFKSTLPQTLRDKISPSILEGVQQQRTSETWDLEKEQIAQYGWGGAGMWYNKIAQINGSLVTAVNNTPLPKSLPRVLEYAKAKNLQQNVKTPMPITLNLSDNTQMPFDSEGQKAIAEGLVKVSNYWLSDSMNQSREGGQTKVTNNIIVDVINTIFGTRGLFDMCSNTNVHPLAQLSLLGKGLVEASIANIGLGLAFTAVGASQSNFVGAASSAAASMFMTVASITITMGFILFYVLPFMPFLYFFFAVGGWVKGLFEAMVGVPLWALAHLHIDGEGLPGEAAMDGYYLIFEIFLRPILIVFGLLGSVVIFAAMVKVLNEIYSLVVTNLSGHDQTATTACGGLTGGGTTGGGGNAPANFFRGPIDEFFFTVIYAIIVYMIGMSCFKLIDLVPNNLLRYMNARVQTFNDAAHDPAEGMLTKLSVGSGFVSQQAISAAQSGVTSLGKAGQAAASLTGVSQKP